MPRFYPISQYSFQFAAFLILEAAAGLRYCRVYQGNETPASLLILILWISGYKGLR